MVTFQFGKNRATVTGNNNCPDHLLFEERSASLCGKVSHLQAHKPFE
jgi:hypothetical protein